MLLAIDIGNTQTVIGLFEKEKLLSSWRMVTPRYETSDEIAATIFNFLNNSGFNPKKIKEVALSCVVPRIAGEITKMSFRYFGSDPFVVKGNIKSDLVINYEFPEEIGADRIANAVAAKEEYGFPAIAVDFGTATTFDILSSEGHYIGGVIAPGIEISSEALFRYAAKLSNVGLTWPKKVIGTNTRECMRSGILFGTLGQVDYLINRIIEEEQKRDKHFKPRVISTGGLAMLINSRSRYIEVTDPDLTLKGLRILFDKNR